MCSDLPSGSYYYGGAVMIPVRYADIDLSNGQVRDYPLSEAIVRMYLGGKGLAAYILYQELAPGIDPLSADNVLIINTTPLTGTGAPCTSRFNASSKNALTGGIASSNCGGTLVPNFVGLDTMV